MSITKATRDLVYQRDGQSCVRCGVYANGGSIHHRKARGMGGTRNPLIDMPAALLLLCGSGTTGCHGWVESHRTKSLGQGFLLRDVALAEVIPVVTVFGPRYFTNSGDVLLRWAS